MQAWTKGHIEVQPWLAIPERMVALGLTDEDGMRQAWFVDAAGRLTGGAEAINQAMRYVWWAKPFTGLYYLPGVRQMQERGYRWIAENRYRMPGSTAACEVEKRPSDKTVAPP